MNKEEIQEAIKIIQEPITVNSIEYKYFTQENYEKLLKVYENCQWFINNWEQFQQNIEDLQKKAELGEHYKHLYSEVKKQKDEIFNYIKSFEYYIPEDNKNELLRMLGETDE